MTRVAVYASTYLPTSETFVHEQVRSFSAWRPTVVHRTRANQDRFPLDGVPTLTLPPMARRIAATTRRLTPVGRKLTKGTEDMYVAGALRRARIDLLIAHFGPAAMEIRRSARMARVPLVPIFHGYDATESLTGKRFQDVYPGLIESSALILAVSGFIRDRLIAAGVPEPAVRTHHLGVPLPPAPEVREGRTASVLLQVGRLMDVKGHAMTLRAFARLVPDRPDLRLRLAGDGVLRPSLQELARSLGIQDQVTFLGDIPVGQIRAELAAADVFLHPSLTVRTDVAEGLGTSILEAMAHGLPVVATQSGGIPESVTPDTGFLVPEHDVDGMAAAITKLIDSPELRRSMGLAGRRRVEQHFDIRTNTAELEATLPF